MGLLERVAFHLEGTESKIARNPDGEPVYIEQTFGPDRWIELAVGGRMTALDLLAIILFDVYLTTPIDARTVVNGWRDELRRAVTAGEVTPRNFSSLLPCIADFEGLGWVVSRADAIRLMERHDTGIDLDATIAHLMEETYRAGKTHFHAETGEPIRTLWKPGYEPQKVGCLPSRIEPVEWCLMLPDFGDAEPETPQPAPVPEAVASAPAGAGSALPPPVETGDIAHAFAGLKWPTEAQWKKPLGAPPLWLKAGRVSPGRRGVCEATWNPVTIGAALAHAGHASVKSVKARFQTRPALTPWLDAWKDYEATHFPD